MPTKLYLGNFGSRVYQAARQELGKDFTLNIAFDSPPDADGVPFVVVVNVAKANQNVAEVLEAYRGGKTVFVNLATLQKLLQQAVTPQDCVFVHNLGGLAAMSLPQTTTGLESVDMRAYNPAANSVVQLYAGIYSVAEAVYGTVMLRTVVDEKTGQESVVWAGIWPTLENRIKAMHSQYRYVYFDVEAGKTKVQQEGAPALGLVARPETDTVVN